MSSEDSADSIMEIHIISSIPRGPSQSSSKSSIDSSLDGSTSVTSILRPSSAMTMTRTFSAASVSFAPLPKIEARRRTSSVQLGVAARSRMLRNRRVLQGGVVLSGGVSSDDLPPLPDHPGIAPTWNETLPRDEGLAEDAVEDAFIAIGRMFNKAGKSLWRRMSSRDSEKVRKKSEGSTEKDNEASQGDEEVTVHVLAPESSEPLHDEPEPLAGEEGGTWEEEISEQLRSRILAGMASAAVAPEAQEVDPVTNPTTIDAETKEANTTPSAEGRDSAESQS